MPDQPFRLSRVRAEESVAASISRSLESLLPREVSSHPTAAWFLQIQERSRAGSPYLDTSGGQHLEGSSLFLAVSILQPVIQARLDFLAGSLYAIGRVLGVSQRAMDLIQTWRTTRGRKPAALVLHDMQEAEADELLGAVRESLPSMLAALDKTHGRRRSLAARAFEDWVAEAEGFRSVFEPADQLLSEISARPVYGEAREVLAQTGSSLARLVIYLSKYPRLGAHAEPHGTVAGDRDSLILSVGEMVGVLSLMADPDDRFAARDFGDAIRDLSLDSLITAELARLERSIASYDPFGGEIIGPPPESLQAAMRDHVLSNGRQSPWLRAFLNRIGKPLRWWDSALASGTADNGEYIADLARSAHATIIHELLRTDRAAGEPWDAFLDRLLRDEWLKNFRESATRRSNREHWSRESFIAVGVAVRDQLRREGYQVSATAETLATLWDSA